MEDNELDALVPEWLTVPDLADELGVDAAQVRRMIEVRELVGVKRTERNILQVPAAFITDGGVVKNLKGTLTVLSDSGLTDAESIRWLFTEDETLPGSPIDALRRGAKTEIRRRAQALAL